MVVTVDEAISGKFRHPLPFLKHTHGHRKPRERCAPQGEFFHMGETTETLDELGSAAVFRLVDGGYTENQGAASTLAEMQKNPSDGPLKLLLVTNVPVFS